MGVDVARFGDDRTVIRFRVAATRAHPSRSSSAAPTRCRLPARIADEQIRHRCEAIFVDGGGVGGGVVDRLRQLHVRVTEVQFGRKADRANVGQDGAIVYANKRAEMWGTCVNGSPPG